MKEVGISEFKSKCLDLLEKVHRTRKPIRVTRFGKPIADVVPAGNRSGTRSSLFGSMKNSIEIRGDIVSPAIDEDEWEVLRDADRVAMLDVLNKVGEESRAKGCDKLTSREINKLIQQYRAEKRKPKR